MRAVGSRSAVSASCSFTNSDPVSDGSDTGFVSVYNGGDSEERWAMSIGRELQDIISLILQVTLSPDARLRACNAHHYCWLCNKTTNPSTSRLPFLRI